MKLRIISAKFVAILLAVCAIISAIPFSATAEENETLEVPATLEWITVNNGRVEVFCADSNGDPIKAPNWLYYSILCEYEIYFNGKTEDDLLMTVDGDPYYADITASQPVVGVQRRAGIPQTGQSHNRSRSGNQPQRLLYLRRKIHRSHG